jgi:DNA-binding NtrC family response regulator
MDSATLARHLIGDSAPMRALRASIIKVAAQPFPVLILGPRGSGKELVAHALHATSGRAGPFVAFNISAIAESMLEDALFGHVRGAFTGAVAEAPGYLLEAHQGTLFLDEIGGMSDSAQRKILRALETKSFRPVGARRDRNSEFRLVAATNDDLAVMVQGGRFRADLADRVGVLIFRVPPLVDRLADLPLLVEHFLRRLDPTGETEVTRGALATLAFHDWPGNVRELKHVVERAYALRTTSTLGEYELSAAVVERLTAAAPAERRSVGGPADRTALVAVLDDVEWDIDRAAAALGVDRTTIYRRLRRHGIRPRERRELPRAVVAVHVENEAQGGA